MMPAALSPRSKRSVPSARSIVDAVLRLVAMLAAGVLAGCAHAPLNQPLARYDYTSSYRYQPAVPEAPDAPLSIVLFFSGGGTRAAALSYGVMQELARTPMPGGGRMLDRVEIISAVSGGAFPAAYYCLYGDRLFRDFEKDFMKRDVQDALWRRCLAPVNGVRLASGYFARSDLAAEYYDELLFHGATFGDLLRTRAGRPFLLINATDMVSGFCFPFTQDAFDLIGSDLASYPLARAVAASSAVPVVLTPITLKNFSGRLPPPESPWLHWVADTMRPTRRQAMIAANARSFTEPGVRPYVHLVDGGLADNLGLSSLFAAVTMNGGWARLLDLRGGARTGRVAIIVVNASTEAKSEWSRDERTPRLGEVVAALSKSGVNRGANEMLEQIRESLDAWERDPVSARYPRISLIDVNFSRIPDPVERRYFEGAPTRLNLPPEMVDRLVEVGGRLLRHSLEFQTLQVELETGRKTTGASSPP